VRWEEGSNNDTKARNGNSRWPERSAFTFGVSPGRPGSEFRLGFGGLGFGFGCAVAGGVTRTRTTTSPA